jgi:hypothetical protein
MDWARQRAKVLLPVGGVVVLIVIVALVFALSSSSGGSSKIQTGALVGSGPLTTGYRLQGTVKARSADSVTVDITQVDSAASEARNVLLRPGVQIEFDHPRDGPVELARNNHVIATALAIHVGDTVTLVGQFTDVGVPPAPDRQGYAYLAIEAHSS